MLDHVLLMILPVNYICFAFLVCRTRQRFVFGCARANTNQNLCMTHAAREMGSGHTHTRHKAKNHLWFFFYLQNANNTATSASTSIARFLRVRMDGFAKVIDATVHNNGPADDATMAVQADHLVRVLGLSHAVFVDLHVAQVADVPHLIVRCAVIHLKSGPRTSQTNKRPSNAEQSMRRLNKRFFFGNCCAQTYFVWIVVAASACASVGQVAFFVDVEAVLAGRQSKNGYLDQHRFAAAILRECNVAVHAVWPINHGNRFHWFHIL